MILEKVKGLIAEQFGIESDEISEKTSLTEDLNADSLDIVELIMALEEEFDIQISDEEVEGIKTVADVVKFIEKKQ